MSDSISRKGVSAWLYNMGHYKLADAVMDENRFPSEGRAHGEYTTEEVAEILAISHNTAYELVRSGKIHSVRVGRSYRIPLDAVIDYLSKH